MYRSKSMLLVAFVLVAVVVASVVGGGVWAKSGGGGVTIPAVSSQVVPVASPCRVPVTTVFTAGVKDNFATGNSEPNSPGPALQTFMGSYAGGTQGFDGNTANRVFGHTFTGLPLDILAAKLEIGVKAIDSKDPANGDSEYDMLKFGMNSPNTFIWQGSMFYLTFLMYPEFTVSWQPGTSSTTTAIWNTGQSAVFTVNLATWNGVPHGVLANINNSQSLDVFVEDDTAVDYITLTVETCSTTTYIYSVKIVCGTVTPPRPKPSIPTLRDPAPVVPGLYRTAVNIHNFWEKETTFLQKVAIALPQDQPRGPVTRKVQTSLRSNEAVEVDCFNVVAILAGTNSADAQFLKGFVVIESPVELEVIAVYTAEELQENGISIDVEQIQPHVIRPSAPSVASCTPTGTLSNGTGIAAGAPIALGAITQITTNQVGTFTITLPAGVTGTASSGSVVVMSSPVALVAGVNVIRVLGAPISFPSERFLVILSCQ